ncbi:hypothetical protein DTO164E3_8378 [Paecilomyces variotii]|nr:hypothetical protein DTO164E3_8378 [Paecilomyces variotii]KAJ9199450.1 hypothetical protein DTO032I3_4973 [Paecilomyces variotii]KAJ9274688.1 hypothetical protein DTO021D3_8418 [Paecilomyces variotii]KAJ9339006.1 hypothetical protein DTO027B6_8415 [Paecilomyces variotii]KAJ9348471.1 hypothetical protein DTO027B9_8294 [Paecilomyces variotii]
MDSSAAEATPKGSGLPLAFHGTIIHSLDVDELEIIEDGLLVVGGDGKIEALRKNVSKDQVNSIVSEVGYTPDVFPVKYLKRGEFLCPGFIDTHNHAPQWAQRGVGRGLVIMDWLNKVTFPHEAKFEDPEYAKRTYASCVSGFLKQGITTASYYGSKHCEATKILAEICLEKGQRAYVGKCNMNRNAPDWYRDLTAEESIQETRDFIAHVRAIDPEKSLVTPILTPRFAISCTHDVLAGLGEIAKENPDLPIQTHFNEAEQEMEITKELFPEFENEADLYEHFNLLNERSILAHCIYVDEYEMGRLKALNCGVSHCPISNTTAGVYMVAPIREYLRRGIKVGLGTDSGGGYSASIIDAMRQAFIVSNARQVLTKGKDPSLSLKECFFLATLGGAQVCCLDDKIGNFKVGKEFDALEIHTEDTEHPSIITPIEDEDSNEIIWEKFLMSGDDRNIAKVYVRASREIGNRKILLGFFDQYVEACLIDDKSYRHLFFCSNDLHSRNGIVFNPWQLCNASYRQKENPTIQELLPTSPSSLVPLVASRGEPTQATQSTALTF